MIQHTPSRRKFMSVAGKATLAAGAVHLLSRESAHAAESADATLRWGIIGTGTRGMWTHLPVLKSAPESKLIALCDVAEQRLSAAAGKVGNPVQTYADYQKLLSNPDVNAVVIAVPNFLHREMLLAALQAGKHVLCEKPAGATPSDAMIMKQAAESARTVVMFGMQYRNSPTNQKILEILASGRIGKPRYLIQNCSRGDWNTSPDVWQYADPALGGKPMNWRYSHTASGGTLNEFDCHYFDLLHWFAGALPETASCEGGISYYHDGRDTWDHASVTLQYPDSVTAVHTLCLFGPGRSDLTIMGDEGSLQTTQDGLRVTNPGKAGPPKTKARTEQVAITPGPRRSADDATLGLYEDFLACVKTGKKPEASPARAVAASRTCWLAELANTRKAQVKWDDLG
jgi:predicted dehydrogenase